jgi:predicted membrane protein
MKKISKLVGVLAISMLPAVAFAQGISPTTKAAGDNVNQLFDIISKLANRSIGILVTLALAVFFWGLVQYLFKLGAGKGEHGKDLMIYGVVALFVMVSIWGIISFISGFFGFSGNETGTYGDLIPKEK